MSSGDLSEELKIYFVSNTEMLIPRNMLGYTVTKNIFETLQCVVVQASHPQNHKVAIKCVPIKFYNDGKEATIAELFNHPNVIKIIDKFFYPKIKKRFFAIVMPRAEIDLFEFVRQYGTFSEETVKIIIFDVLNAIVHIHSSGVWHRDIKPENLLLLEEGENKFKVVIADFGLAEMLEGIEVFEGIATGTIEYAAPELIERDPSKIYGLGFKKNARYRNNVDVWSVGATMFFLLTRTLVFQIKKGEYDIDRHLEGRVILEHLDNLSDDALDFMRFVMNPDPEKRPSAQKAVEHRWFDSLTKKLNQ